MIMQLTVLLVIMKCIVLSVHALSLPPATPCPKIFNYARIHPKGDIIFPGNANLYWRGIIRIPANVISTRKAVHLRVLLTVPAALQTKYVGRVDFLGDKEKLVKGDLTLIEYNISFPANSPIPKLQQIQVNDQTICNGFPIQGTIVTKIILEHSIFPLRVNITPRIFDTEVVSQSNCVDDQLVNSPLAAGEWPWLVPIFAASENGHSIRFLCAGSLVSSRYLVSAAHCFRDIDNIDVLVAYVGRRNIRNWADAENQPRSIKKLHIHPDFNGNTMYSDLAVLELSSPVVWSRTVRPVCLWNGPEDLNLIVGRKATVVGWGTDDASKTDVMSEPNSAELPIVSQETCLRSSIEFHYLSSNRTLCAGARDGSGPCNGDSGGGLYIPLRNSGGNTQWYLRGVVSLSLLSSSGYNCDLHQFAVFTDVAQFKNWLHSVMTL